MSSATPFDTSLIPDRSLQAVVQYPVRLLGFWSAIVLPFVILSLIVAGVAQQSPTLLAGLLAANIAGLVLGKDYNR